MGGHGDCTWMVIYLLQGQVPLARAEHEQNPLFWAEKTEVLQSKDSTHCSCPCSQTVAADQESTDNFACLKT